MNVLEDFKVLIKENGQLNKELSNVHSKYLKSNKGILEALTKIAFIQYARNDYENALLVVDMLSKIPFNYHYDYWTWVEYAIALRAEISTLNVDTNKLEHSLGIINNALNSGEGLQKKLGLMCITVLCMVKLSKLIKVLLWPIMKINMKSSTTELSI